MANSVSGLTSQSVGKNYDKFSNRTHPVICRCYSFTLVVIYRFGATLHMYCSSLQRWMFQCQRYSGASIATRLIFDCTYLLWLLIRRVHSAHDHSRAAVTTQDLHSESHIKPISHKISCASDWYLFCPIILKFRTEHGSETPMYCSKFQHDWVNETNVMNERVFERLGFKCVSVGGVSYIATAELAQE